MIGRASDDGGGGARSCRLVAVNAHGSNVLIVFEVDGRDVPVEVPLPPATRHALCHIAALHGHDRDCRRRVQVHVGLLRRALYAAGAWPLCVLVQPGPPPAFRLRVVVHTGRAVEVDVGVLDAVALLLSRRLPVAVADGDVDPWDDTVGRLLEGGGS